MPAIPAPSIVSRQQSPFRQHRPQAVHARSFSPLTRVRIGLNSAAFRAVVDASEHCALSTSGDTTPKCAELLRGGLRPSRRQLAQTEASRFTPDQMVRTASARNRPAIASAAPPATAEPSDAQRRAYASPGAIALGLSLPAQTGLTSPARRHGPVRARRVRVYGRLTAAVGVRTGLRFWRSRAEQEVTRRGTAEQHQTGQCATHAGSLPAFGTSRRRSSQPASKQPIPCWGLRSVDHVGRSC